MTGDIFGCRHWRRRCYWHLVGRRQGCYSTSYQDGPTTVIRPQMSPGHRCATMGSAHGAGLGAFPAGMAALRRGASLSHVFGTRASEALQTPALWSEPEPERRLAPLGQTQTRAASQRGHPSSSPPGTQIEGVGRTPQAWKTCQLLPPATLITSVSARKAFLPEGGCCRRPPRPAQLRGHPQRRVQGLRAHLAFGSGTSASPTGVGAGPPGGDRCPAQPFPNGSPGRAGDGDCAVGECACARMRKRRGV